MVLLCLYLDTINVDTLSQPLSTRVAMGKWDYAIISDNICQDLSVWAQERNDLQEGSMFTLIVYDRHAPYPNNPIRSPFLHYLATNITTKYNSGDVILEWMSPQPPDDSPLHCYVFTLFGQDKAIPRLELDQRKNFDLEGFIQGNSLVQLDRIKVSIGH